VVALRAGDDLAAALEGPAVPEAAHA